MGRALEGEFARRLEGLAATGAAQVSAADLRDARILGEEGTGFIALQLLLEQLRSTPGTLHTSVVDSTGTVVYETRGAEYTSGPSPLDSLAREPLRRALEGRRAVSGPYRLGRELVRAGLAPVRSSDGHVAGVLAVEARVGYLAELAEFRRGLLFTSVVFALVILALAAVIVRYAWSQSQLERRLSRAENLAAMGQLTATLAHEIKNPLAIIRGSAQRLGKLEPEAQRMADFVMEESDRLSRTVARYLQFARGDVDPAGAGDAAATLEATLDLLEGELQARKVRLERRAEAASALPVRLDNESLKQVFLNVMLNALDAMPEGGALTVEVGERRGRVEIRISDTGAGMAAETLKRLGDPFYTTKSRGSGLGLFLTRRLLRSAGGSLEVRSALGRGTECIIRLPRRKVRA